MAKNELDLQMEDYQYLPLRDVVFRTLRQAILRGELKPGERLMEIRLANQLGVSRTPIREAIRMLELDGLVIMVPRKGAQVAQITEKDLNDVLEVRLGLEELAVKLACQRITESELQKLYQASRSFEQMLETTETDDLQKLAKADVAFHDVIYQATNNERLIQLLNNLREQMYRYRIEYLKDVKSRRSLVEEHDALYERMKNRDLAGAQKMIVDNANEEIDALHRIDPAKTAVVDKKFSAEVKSAAETDTLGTIKLTAYEPNDLKYEVNSKTGGTVVFSEIYYPGWQAYIDGVEAPHGRADYILRAMNVPAGKHVVEFKFDPKSLHVTETVAFVALGVLTCVLVLFLFLQVRRARRKID